jgi:hypothetical protein
MPIGGPDAPVHCIIDSSGVTIQPHLNCALRKAVGERFMVRVMVGVRVWIRMRAHPSRRVEPVDHPSYFSPWVRLFQGFSPIRTPCQIAHYACEAISA